MLSVGNYKILSIIETNYSVLKVPFYVENPVAKYTYN